MRPTDRRWPRRRPAMADPYASNLQSIDHAMPMTYLLPPIAEVHDVSHERGVVERRPESEHPNAQPLGHGRERVLAVPGLLCSTRHLEGHALPLRPRTEQWQTSAKLPCRQTGPFVPCIAVRPVERGHAVARPCERIRRRGFRRAVPSQHFRRTSGGNQPLAAEYAQQRTLA